MEKSVDIEMLDNYILAQFCKSLYVEGQQKAVLVFKNSL
jgi:hypothetical protein